MLQSLVRALLYCTMPYVIGRVGSVSSHLRRVLTELFPIVAAALRAGPQRRRA